MYSLWSNGGTFAANIYKFTLYSICIYCTKTPLRLYCQVTGDQIRETDFDY